jgi:hypothetical protein
MAHHVFSGLARLALSVLALGLALAAIPKVAPAARASDGVSLSADGNRLSVETLYLQLQVNLRQPSIDVIRVAPQGDGQYGGNIGALIEEISANGRWARSTDDPDGAQALWSASPDGVRVEINGIDSGNLASSTWVLTVPNTGPSLQIDRLLRLPGPEPVDGVALTVVSPIAPDGADPPSLARMLNLATYRPEVGPAILEQQGGLLGLLAVDNPELSFSARAAQPDRVSARTEGSDLALSLWRRIAPSRSAGQLTESASFRFGWNNDYRIVRSDFAPDLESRLLSAGYFGNAVLTPTMGALLSASMRDYRGSVWSRDTDYALQGYGYVLDDMAVFRNTLQSFLDRIDPNGVAPEYLLVDGQHGNRQSWDSMANVVQATYTYVAKTGDLDFYRRNEAVVKLALGWIRGLDTDNDGLPDRDIFPYGYTDTVENGPLHTYAIARFYAAFEAVAELDEAIGQDGQAERSYARAMQTGFSRPLTAGGYWNPASGYPIAWRRASGAIYTTFETFGVFEAIRVGLLTNPAQLQSIASWLDANRDAFVNGNAYPERLMIDGYDLLTRKAEVPIEKLWIMDSNAPWITGISVPARVTLGRLDDARAMLDVYASSANRRTPHAEFGAGPLGRYGAGETQDGGRLWDNWSWFSAVYGTHFGLKMRPRVLEIAPAPLGGSQGRRLYDVTYQGAHVNLDLLEDGYRVQLDAPRRLLLRPPAGFSKIDVNGDGLIQPTRQLTTAPNTHYVIRAYR